MSNPTKYPWDSLMESVRRPFAEDDRCSCGLCMRDPNLDKATKIALDFTQAALGRRPRDVTEIEKERGFPIFICRSCKAGDHVHGRYGCVNQDCECEECQKVRSVEPEMEMDLSRHCAGGHHDKCGNPHCGCQCHDEPEER